MPTEHPRLSKHYMFNQGAIGIQVTLPFPHLPPLSLNYSLTPLENARMLKTQLTLYITILTSC